MWGKELLDRGLCSPGVFLVRILMFIFVEKQLNERVAQFQKKTSWNYNISEAMGKEGWKKCLFQYLVTHVHKNVRIKDGFIL